MMYLLKSIKFLIKSSLFYYSKLSAFLINSIERLEYEILFFKKNEIKYPISSKTKLVLQKDLFLTKLIIQDFEFEERYLVSKILSKKGIFIDIGANIGLYSLIAAETIKENKIYAFEPTASILTKLQTNIKLNNYTNIDIINYAVSNFDYKKLLMYFNENGYDVFNSYQKSNKLQSYSKEVNTICLDTFIKNYNIKFNKIQFIKIDVEGMELQVLEGAKNLIQHSTNTIYMIEFNHSFKILNTNCCKVFQLLKENNYNLYKYIHHEKELKNIELFRKEITGNFFAIHQKNITNIQSRLNKYKIKILN